MQFVQILLSEAVRADPRITLVASLILILALAVLFFFLERRSV